MALHWTSFNVKISKFLIVMDQTLSRPYVTPNGSSSAHLTGETPCLPRFPSQLVLAGQVVRAILQTRQLPYYGRIIL
ncbi:hypothetical protein N7508_006129 [Penicillium antarcticum]|nr:uncharacterized protein N7508_006129 [Penicillium antarcticum]KAJ5301266.1 hypothetical protein N7508_006129 [Penicillium antarcticum]